jgi:hypothetical protein
MFISGSLLSLIQIDDLSQRLTTQTNFHFDTLFHHIYLIVYTMLKNHGPIVYPLMSQWMYICRGLLASLYLTRHDLDDNNPYRRKHLHHSLRIPRFCLRDHLVDVLTCTKDVSRLLECFADHEKSFNKHAPYLISDIIYLQKELPSLPQSIRTHILPGIYAIFRICSKHELDLINIWLDEAGKTIFHSLHADYTRYHKFTGKV